MEREKVGAVGTGKYEGYVWDGHHWVDPFTMKRGKFDSWQRTGIWWKAFVVVLICSTAFCPPDSQDTGL